MLACVRANGSCGGSVHVYGRNGDTEREWILCETHAERCVGRMIPIGEIQPLRDRLSRLHDQETITRALSMKECDKDACDGGSYLCAFCDTEETLANQDSVNEIHPDAYEAAAAIMESWERE